MKIIQRYILKELSFMFLISLGVFTFVLLIGNLVQLAELIINKGVEISLVATLFINLLPFLLSYTIPMATLAAALIVFGRLSSENEITAIKTGGISICHLAIPLLVIGLIISLVSFFLNDEVLPRTHFSSRKVLKNIGIKNPASYLESGTFIKSFKDYIIFVYEVNKNKLKNIRIYQLQENKPTRTIIASSGEFMSILEQNAIKLKLQNGTSDEPDPKDPGHFYKLQFKTYFLTLNLDKDLSQKIEKKPKEMTISELKSEVRRLGKDSIDTIPLITEIHRKVSISFASFAFILLGISLGIFTKRGERSVQFAIALLVIVVYYILFAGSIAISLKGILHPAFWLYTPNLLLIASGALFFYKIGKT